MHDVDQIPDPHEAPRRIRNYRYGKGCGSLFWRSKRDLYRIYSTHNCRIDHNFLLGPAGFEDLQDEICRLIPTRIDFKHQFDTPQDAAGHVKSSMLGVSLSLIIADGKLLLGGSQGIYFVEFDGPRNREFYVKIQADPS